MGDAGIGRQNEEHGVCIGQQRQCQFWLGADGVQAGGVENHQTLFEQGVREIDQRVPPARNLHHAVGVRAIQIVVFLVSGETELARFIRRDPGGFADMAQGVLQAFR